MHSSHKITINKNTLLQDLTDTAEENFWRSSKTQSPLTVTKSSYKHGVKLHRTLVNTPGFSDQLNNKQCCQPIAAFLENTFRGHQSICLPLFFITPSGQGLQHFDVHDLPYLGKLMVGEGTRVSTEISPHFEIHCTTTFQLIHFGISGERNFKTRQICAFSYGWVCHSVTNVLHFAGDRVVSLFGMQNIIYEKLNRILQ